MGKSDDIVTKHKLVLKPTKITVFDGKKHYSGLFTKS